MASYYWTCPRCGANLDHGERCDCTEGGVSEAEALSRRQAPHRISIRPGTTYRTTARTTGTAYMRAVTL